MTLSEACRLQGLICKDVRDIEHLNGQISVARYEAQRAHAHAFRLQEELKAWWRDATEIQQEAYIDHCSRMGLPAVAVIPTVEGS